MELHYAILLGVVQGLTEFLPVSSSGHLVLFQNLFGLTEPEIFFDISVHVGTLAAVCVVFFKDLRAMVSALFSISTWYLKEEGLWENLARKPEMRLMALILAGTVPTVLLGLIIRPMAEKVFASVSFVGFMLLVTGLLLWLTRRRHGQGRDESRLTIWDALWIGTIQGAAILPGISRSGATIAMGLFRGLDRENAARYSFLLSIPAILGAMVLELTRVSGFPPAGVVLLGALSAGIVGYGALKVLIHLVNKGNLHLFAPYCWILGLAVLVSAF